MSDCWLTDQQSKLCQDLHVLIEEVKHVTTAYEFKKKLQQENKVPVRFINNNNDEVVIILPLIDAVKVAMHLGYNDQLNTWRHDGYDVDVVAENYG